MYLDQLLLEKSLSELIDKETEMAGSIRSLDSSMQTLVYENYNKFIGATDTIRKVSAHCFQVHTHHSFLKFIVVWITI